MSLGHRVRRSWLFIPALLASPALLAALLGALLGSPRSLVSPYQGAVRWIRHTPLFSAQPSAPRTHSPSSSTGATPGGRLRFPGGTAGIANSSRDASGRFKALTV